MGNLFTVGLAFLFAAVGVHQATGLWSLSVGMFLKAPRCWKHVPVPCSGIEASQLEENLVRFLLISVR